MKELEHGREVAGDARLVLAWHMLQWGRTTRQKAFSAAVVEAVFRRENGLPVTVDPPMSSGWTQVAALATDDLEGDPRHAPHVIWDSRVSTSLVFRLDKLMVDREGQDPKAVFLRIDPVPGRGGSRKVGGRATHRGFGCAGRTSTAIYPRKTPAASSCASCRTG